MPWRREWLPTLVFWLGEFHGQGSLVGYSPWGCKESNMTERLSLSKIQKNDYWSHNSTGTALMKLTSSISLANFKIPFQFCSHLDFVPPFILFSNPCKGILKYFQSLFSIPVICFVSTFLITFFPLSFSYISLILFIYFWLH